MSKDGERCAFDEVRAVIKKAEVQGFVPGKELSAVKADLYELQAKLKKLQEEFPAAKGVEFSPYVNQMVKLVGQRKIRDRWDIRRAAIFF